MKRPVSGVLAPITTPFANEEVCLEHLRRNIRRYGDTPLTGYFVLGSNGESECLGDHEKWTIVETVARERRSDQIVIAGAGSQSSHQSILNSRRAAEMGADFVSLITPSYFKKRLTSEAMARYYLEVADAIPVPLFVYNAPEFTGVSLSPEVIETLSDHPNIAGMKDSSEGLIVQYTAFCRRDFNVLAGSINSLFSGLLLGASGGVVSLANAFPDACCALAQEVESGSLAEARGLHMRLVRLNRAVSGSFGVAGIKYAMDLAGYHGGTPRRPLSPLTVGDQEQVRKAIELSRVRY